MHPSRHLQAAQVVAVGALDDGDDGSSGNEAQCDQNRLGMGRELRKDGAPTKYF